MRIVAMALLASTASNPVAGGPWVADRLLDAMTDKASVSAAAVSVSGTMTIVVTCNVSDREIFIAINNRPASFGGGRYLSEGNRLTDLQIRIDSGAALTFSELAANRNTIIVAERSVAIGRQHFPVMFNALRNAKARILLRGSDFRDGLLEGSFSAKGVGTALSQVSAACAPPA